jgi:hypothetical protein
MYKNFVHSTQLYGVSNPGTVVGLLEKKLLELCLNIRVVPRSNTLHLYYRNQKANAV